MPSIPHGRTLRLALILATFAALPAIGPAKASDGPLQHALQAARCLAPSVRQVAKHSHVIVYEASCAAPTPRVLTFSCTRAACRSENPADDDQP